MDIWGDIPAAECGAGSCVTSLPVCDVAQANQ